MKNNGKKLLVLPHQEYSFDDWIEVGIWTQRYTKQAYEIGYSEGVSDAQGELHSKQAENTTDFSKSLSDPSNIEEEICRQLYDDSPVADDWIDDLNYIRKGTRDKFRQAHTKRTLEKIDLIIEESEYENKILLRYILQKHLLPNLSDE